MKIEYYGCEKGRISDEIIFLVENKMDVELTFQAGSFAFDGQDLGYMSGSDSIAPKSKGKIQFDNLDGFSTLSPTTITGTIKVIDFSRTALSQSYEVKFVNLEV